MLRITDVSYIQQLNWLNLWKQYKQITIIHQLYHKLDISHQDDFFPSQHWWFTKQQDITDDNWWQSTNQKPLIKYVTPWPTSLHSDWRSSWLSLWLTGGHLFFPCCSQWKPIIYVYLGISWLLCHISLLHCEEKRI